VEEEELLAAPVNLILVSAVGMKHKLIRGETQFPKHEPFSVRIKYIVIQLAGRFTLI
jgi:hypothetical protein